MQVNSLAGHQANLLSQANQVSTDDPASASSFAAALKGAQSANTSGPSPSTMAVDTNHGRHAVNLDDYFSPTPATGPVNLDDVPLLLPSAHNIDTLSRYSEDKFKALLAEYDIPAPPESLEFDAEGKLRLPADYPYREQLSKALEENPSVEEAMRTTLALASHYVGIMEGAAFRDEMSVARSQAQREQIIQKYSYLFDDNRPAPHMLMRFLNDGSLLVAQKASA